MPTYSYTALKNNKDIVKGKIDALDARSARDAIKKMGLLPTKITDDSARASNDKTSEKKNIPVKSIKTFSLKEE